MTTADEADKKARVERARETGLFRYSLVQELLEPGLSQAERGWRARELAGRAHEGPGGRRVTVSYATLSRWRRRYEEGGFDALVPSAAAARAADPEEVLALAEALKREKPGRTAAQVRRVLQVTSGWAPSDRTLQRLFERLELNRPAPGAEEEQRAFGRFECARPNEMWTGDTLHGPVIGGKKSYLFAFIDDHSRAVMGARWSHHDNVVRMAAGFRPALQARGVPRSCYLDNGPLCRRVAAARLRGPGHKARPLPARETRGKRQNRTFFQDRAGPVPGRGRRRGGVAGLAEMNRLFQAWLETAYHQAVHSETGEAPAARWEKATPAERAVRSGPAAGGVLVVRAAQGRQDRPGPPARQRLPGRRVAGRADTSSCCSTRSTWTGSRSAWAGSPQGPRSRSSWAGTATPRPAPPTGRPAPSPPPPGSTTSAPSATATTPPCATRSPTSSSSPAAGTGEPGRTGEQKRKEGEGRG